MNIEFSVLSLDLLKDQDFMLLADVFESKTNEEYKEYCKFWKEWSKGIILGGKSTIAVKFEGVYIGVIRFWKTPYYSNTWLIEGLYVKADCRKLRLAEKMIKLGLAEMEKKEVTQVYVHIKDKNTPSKSLFKKLDFVKNEEFRHLNSFGRSYPQGSEYYYVLGKK